MATINTPPLNGPLVNSEGAGVNAFSQWLMQAFRLLFDIQNSGTTAQRPTINLYVGKFYFDDSLGIPIWLQVVGPPAVWIDATGAPV